MFEREAADWLKRWTPVAARLGLAPDGELAVATKTLIWWAGLESDLAAWETLRQRVGEMEGSIGSFDATRVTLAARLSIDAVDPLLTLIQRLEAAQAIEIEHRRLTKDLSALAEKMHSHDHEGREAAATLSFLQRRPGLSDGQELLPAIAQAERHGGLTNAVGVPQRILQAQDDGLSETELAAEADAIDWDTMSNRLDDIRRRLSDLDIARREAAGRQADAKATLARMEAGQDVAGPAEAMHDGLVQIEEVSGRYVRLRLAHALLKSGIERFRRRQQGPLLARASAYFAELHGVASPAARRVGSQGYVCRRNTPRGSK